MSNKSQLQTNNTSLEALIARINTAKNTVDSLPNAGSGGGSTSVNLQAKTVTPTSLPTTISPDSGYGGLSSVTINKDSNLVAGNIKSGTKIFGVTGTYTGSGSSGGTSGGTSVGTDGSISFTYNQTVNFVTESTSAKNVGKAVTMNSPGTCTVSCYIYDVGALTTATVYLYVNGTQKQSKSSEDDRVTLTFSQITVAAGDVIQLKAKSDNNEVEITKITITGTAQLLTVAS